MQERIDTVEAQTLHGQDKYSGCRVRTCQPQLLVPALGGKCSEAFS